MLSLQVNRPEREANHSPPSSAKLKKEWGYISSLPECLHGITGTPLPLVAFFCFGIFV
jgi:hypothetical protein